MDDRRFHLEEMASALTHGVGALASVTGGAVLITFAALGGDGWQLLSAVIFSASLLLLYTSSTVYHAVRHEVARARLQVLDHCAIFLLIAGTYTPFTLVTLRGAWGWTLFGVVWGLAAAGIVFKLFFTGRLRRLSTAMYLGMGWLSIVAARPFLQALSPETLLWLLAGGLSYTMGTAFYHSRRIPFAHAVWHLFVLAGSACHFVAVASQVA
ncbi:MAG TPA: hemolysin III family protein [Longimicrobiaceae bacterium]